ncbi:MULTISPECIES: hypothetical protein [unclassified Guyparkeria]|uniref:hypothetical protein n=1 Tax=unclassified Guyparkeria TaxID=2626246 RepID=UPI00073346C5|nr:MULTISPECIES: hypothetical protein [unclassified Guyparkeria]KTG17233.1 hypothetical protein AUR63_08690 [Guyparkeria sp. XI15]OAE87210.1 hypothetical protein AWR35_08705 [Guyparkeria sp. WRN-7]
MKRNLITTALMLSFAGGSVAAENPSGLPDQSALVLSGTAIEITPSSFVMDYGQGLITVEVDDWEWIEQEARGLIKGDEVTVYGVIDDDFSEARSIEASSLYVENLGTYFAAAPTDDDDVSVIPTLVFNVQTGMDVTGKVSSVSPADKEFTIDSGNRQVTVDTSDLNYDVLDDQGFQQVDKGDLVAVNGHMEDDFLESMQLEADSVVTFAQGYY